MTKETDIIAKEGYLVLAVSLVTAVTLYFWHPVAGIAATAWFFFCLYFFRNPKRAGVPQKGELLSPADGRVLYVGQAQETNFLKRPMQRVTIFMSPLDVHVNRAPVSGEVLATVHHNGRFKAAFSRHASDQNERVAVHLRTDEGEEVVFVQIAGWFARRIRTYVKAGDRLLGGDIFGMIKYGSRMDVYFPESYRFAVGVKDKVRAGKTVIAKKGKDDTQNLKSEIPNPKS